MGGGELALTQFVQDLLASSLFYFQYGVFVHLRTILFVKKLSMGDAFVAVLEGQF